MANNIIQIYDYQSDELIIREMTNEEQTQKNDEIASNLAIKTENEAKEQLKAAAKATAQTKLEALGLTVDDLAALGL